MLVTLLFLPGRAVSTHDEILKLNENFICHKMKHYHLPYDETTYMLSTITVLICLPFELLKHVWLRWAFEKDWAWTDKQVLQILYILLIVKIDLRAVSAAQWIEKDRFVYNLDLTFWHTSSFINNRKKRF